jgi:nucleotide-binding universal stress UspA family protein
MYKKILVAYDGSGPSRKALDTAIATAGRDGAALFVISVCHPPEIGDDVETEAVIEHSKRFHRGLLAEARGHISKAGLAAHYELSVGHPAERILCHADDKDVDLIVIGSRGRSKFAQLLLGSISRHVVQHAGCPVLVVR